MRDIHGVALYMPSKQKSRTRTTDDFEVCQLGLCGLDSKISEH